MNVVGVVLAGGRSSRMGTDKRLLTLASEHDGLGRTYLQHAADRLRACGWPVWLSVEAEFDREVRGVGRVVVDRRRSGPISGLESSLRAAKGDGFTHAMFTPVDVPRIRDDDLRHVSGDGDGSIPQVGFSHQVEPLIGLYPVTLAADLAKSIEQDRRSVRRFLFRHPHVLVPLKPEHCVNHNTPADRRA